MRDIHEETSEYGNALILTGAPFIEALLKRRTLKENYGQIDSRIDYTYKTLGLTEKEAERILEGYKNIDKPAAKEIVAIIMKTS